MNRATRGRVVVGERARRGYSDVADIGLVCGTVKTIIDVGANVGQSATRFRASFPGARIVSLEPVRATFEELCRRTAPLDVECHRLALGSSCGQSSIFLTDFSLTSSLVQPPDGELRGAEVIQLQTLDAFLQQQRIPAVDLLKIDAEGYDLEVLAGGAEAFSAGSVRFVLVETGFQAGDSRHPPFETIREALAPYGYRVWGIYDQTPEWTGERSLRFANTLFYLPRP